MVEQEAPHRRGFEKGNDDAAGVIESRRPPDDGHDAVGTRKVEERFDLAIAEALCHAPQRHLRIELSLETGLPSLFVRGQVRRVESAACKSAGEYVRSDGSAHQAVVDPA